MLLITTFSAQQISQFSIYLTVFLSRSYLISLSLRLLWDSLKSLSRIKISYIHYSPWIHWANHFVVDGYHNGQVWSPICKSMLTTHTFIRIYLYTYTEISIHNSAPSCKNQYQLSREQSRNCPLRRKYIILQHLVSVPGQCVGSGRCYRQEHRKVLLRCSSELLVNRISSEYPQHQVSRRNKMPWERTVNSCTPCNFIITCIYN